METVLITGGSGMIGTELSKLLQQEGYEVTHLSRTPGTKGGIRAYGWDVEKGQIDPGAINTADHIIHLAGAGIADKRWTDKRKQEIIQSRAGAAELLRKQLQQSSNHVKTFVSASAVGYYGDSGETILKENAAPGEGFLSESVALWEAASCKFEKLNIRTVIFRTGIVLSTKGGALKEMDTTRFGVAAYMGSGEQYYSWIHIDDICRLYLMAIQDKQLHGVYNAATPNPVRNKKLMETLLEAKHSKALLVPAPRFALRIALGEMAESVLQSNRCSPEKIEKEGFRFNYPRLPQALKDIYAHKK